METAVTACMTQPDSIDIDALASQVSSCVSSGACDDTTNLQRHRAWIFSGTGDTVVDSGV
jgi:hypothetical protein